ncbi:hypothetical protein P3W45_001484 [Vairimorpha bombi]|jgi:hypothetical protein
MYVTDIDQIEERSGPYPIANQRNIMYMQKTIKMYAVTIIEYTNKKYGYLLIEFICFMLSETPGHSSLYTFMINRKVFKSIFKHVIDLDWDWGPYSVHGKSHRNYILSMILSRDAAEDNEMVSRVCDSYILKNNYRKFCKFLKLDSDGPCYKQVCDILEYICADVVFLAIKDKLILTSKKSNEKIKEILEREKQLHKIAVEEAIMNFIIELSRTDNKD